MNVAVGLATTRRLEGANLSKRLSLQIQGMQTGAPMNPTESTPEGGTCCPLRSGAALVFLSGFGSRSLCLICPRIPCQLVFGTMRYLNWLIWESISFSLTLLHQLSPINFGHGIMGLRISNARSLQHVALPFIAVCPMLCPTLNTTAHSIHHRSEPCRYLQQLGIMEYS